MRTLFLTALIAMLAAFAPPERGVRLLLELDGDPAQTQQTVDVLRKRIEIARIPDVVVEPRGQGRIEARLPASVDSETLTSLLTRPGVLTFNMIDEAPGPGYEQLGVERNGRIALQSEVNDRKPLVIHVDPILTGADIAKASVVKDQVGLPAIAVEFKANGKARFATATSQNVGRAMAIVLDNGIIMAPHIMTPLTGGFVQISGAFTMAEAEQLAVILQSGALPAHLRLIERATFGGEKPQ